MTKKIMVVDDTAFMRSVLKNMIVEEFAYTVIEASTGKEAFEKYKLERPDLTTMDITMPEVDGIAALKLIKNFDPQAKVMMCSAMGQKAMVIEALQFGAVDFIVKPFQKDKIVNTIRNQISK
ncbi:response regulator [Brevibacillus centrosporus]|uniref:response regulator n=1 Tax=Brevibacillus centrosporus TaxID=54910 RepID=UPI002E227FFD|nr:response regulator [Brevibacillus centrosporus]MED1951367.1 response regulator [Brevibacillus centrosporus]